MNAKVPIKLVKNEDAKESGGNWSGTPTQTKYDLFAEIVNPSRAFRTYDAQTQLGVVKTFRVRFRFDLLPTGDWTIEFRGKSWNIVSKEPEQDRLFYWLITANHK